jgi:hypothetical protein
MVSPAHNPTRLCLQLGKQEHLQSSSTRLGLLVGPCLLGLQQRYPIEQ